MSETTTSPAATDANAPVDLSKYNPAFAPLFDVYKAKADSANAKAARIKAATSDQSDAINAVLSTNSDDERIVKWREEDAEITAKIEKALAAQKAKREAAAEYAKTLIPGVDSSFNVEDEKKAFLADRAAATETRKALLTFLGNDQAALAAGIAKHGIVETVSLRGNSAGTSKGSTDIKRPRISTATVNGEEVKDGKGNVSFTFLTTYISKKFAPVDGDVVRNSAFDAAGTNDLSTLPAGTEVKFTLSVGTGDKAQNVPVVVTTKGRTAAEETETETEPESTPAE